MKVTSKVLLCLVVLLVVAAFADAQDESPPKRRLFGFLRSKPTEDSPEGSFNWVGLIAVLAGVGVAATGAMLVQKEKGVETVAVAGKVLDNQKEEQDKKEQAEYEAAKKKKFTTDFVDTGILGGDGLCDKCGRKKEKHTLIKPADSKDPKSVDKWECVPGYGKYTEEYMANELWKDKLKHLDEDEQNEKNEVKRQYAEIAKNASDTKHPNFDKNKKFDQLAHDADLKSKEKELTIKWDAVDAAAKAKFLDSKLPLLKRIDAERKADEDYEKATEKAQKTLDDAKKKPNQKADEKKIADEAAQKAFNEDPTVKAATTKRNADKEAAKKAFDDANQALINESKKATEAREVKKEEVKKEEAKKEEAATAKIAAAVPK